jgi:hypothetical protein
MTTEEEGNLKTLEQLRAEVDQKSVALERARIELRADTLRLQAAELLAEADALAAPDAPAAADAATYPDRDDPHPDQAQLARLHARALEINATIDAPAGAVIKCAYWACDKTRVKYRMGSIYCKGTDNKASDCRLLAARDHGHEAPIQRYSMPRVTNVCANCADTYRVGVNRRASSICCSPECYRALDERTRPAGNGAASAPRQFADFPERPAIILPGAKRAGH